MAINHGLSFHLQSGWLTHVSAGERWCSQILLHFSCCVGSRLSGCVRIRSVCLSVYPPASGSVKSRSTSCHKPYGPHVQGLSNWGQSSQNAQLPLLQSGHKQNMVVPRPTTGGISPWEGNRVNQFDLAKGKEVSLSQTTDFYQLLCSTFSSFSPAPPQFCRKGGFS